MSNYVILDAPSTGELEEAVNSMFEEGFVPAGGVFMDRDEWEDERKGHMVSETIFYQAMVRVPGKDT